MARLFIAVGVSPRVTQDVALTCSGIPGARWQVSEQFHITLQFLGEVDGGATRRLSKALQGVTVPAFETSLQSCGVFPHRGATRALWLGVEDAQPFRELHRQVTQICDEEGLRVERRRFTPHLTVARFSRRPPDRELSEWIQNHFGYRSPRFSVRAVHLFSSVLSPGGAKHHLEATASLPVDELKGPKASLSSTWAGVWPLPNKLSTY